MGAFAVHLELAGVPVVVVGAGPVGRRRVAALRAAGARITWVAPDVPDLPAEENGPERRLAERFRPAHVDGARLAFACAPPAVNAAVAAAARDRGVLVNRADAPDEGDFVVPASVRAGDLLIALSTGGRAPAAAARLRRALEARVPPAWPRFVEVVAGVRARLAGAPDRAARLRALAEGPLLDALERGDDATADALVEAAVRGAPEV